MTQPSPAQNCCSVRISPWKDRAGLSAVSLVMTVLGSGARARPHDVSSRLPGTKPHWCPDAHRRKQSGGMSPLERRRDDPGRRGAGPVRTTIIATNQPFRFRSMVAASGIALSPFRLAVETAARCLSEASRSAPRLRLVHDADEKAAA